MVKNTKKQRRENENNRSKRFSATFIVVAILLLTLIPLTSAGFFDFLFGKNVDTVFDDFHVEGMKVHEFKVNGNKINKLKDTKDDVELESVFYDKGSGNVKQDIWVRNKKPYKRTVDILQTTEIFYDKVRWAGEEYYLTSTPVVFDSWIDKETGNLVIPNIFMDDIHNKRINYRDIAEKGGYATAYESGGKYYIDFRIDGLSLEANEEYYIDPIYTNSTKGFSTSPSGNANPGSVASNGTDYWVADRSDSFIYHYDSNGNNLTGGFSSDLSATTDITSIMVKNETSMWIQHNQAANAFLSEVEYDGTNLTGYFSLNENSMSGSYSYSNDTDIWIADTTDLWIYHLVNLVNQTTGDIGFDVNPSMDHPTGIAMTTSNNFYIRDATNNFMNHYISGVNQSDGFDLTQFGTGGSGGIWNVGNDLVIADDGDNFIYYLEVGELLTTTLNSPEDHFNSTLTEVEFNCSAITDTGLIHNISLWHNISGTFEANQTLDVSGSPAVDVNTTFNVSNIPFADGYNWNCESFSNNSVSSNASSNRTFSVKVFVENSQTFNSTTDEMANEAFSMNITTNGSTPTAKLYFDNVNIVDGTITAHGGNEFIVSATIPAIPIGSGSKNAYWELNIGDTLTNSTSNAITVRETILGICNATSTVSYMNYTFKDENNETGLNASIPTSTFNYWLGSPSVNKTLTFTDTTEQQSFAFCLSAVNRTLISDNRIQFEKTSWPQRVYDPETTSFTNVTTNETLYLLFSGDGIYVTFQVIDVAEQVIEGVFINASRIISGETTLLESGFTSVAGTLTLWLDPDFIYNFAYSASGYNQVSESFAPTNNEYTITLGTTPNVTQDYTRGITYQINPKTNPLFNETTYTFNFTLASSFWTVTDFGFVLKNATESLGSHIVSSNGGTATLDFSTTNQTELTMEFFWTINGTSNNGTSHWFVVSDAGDEWSIKIFFSDFTTYISSGLFGLGDFGLGIIIFLIVFLTTGLISWKFGIQNAAAISMVFFGLVLLFDVGLGLMSGLTPIGAIPYLPTIFCAIIMLALLVREGIKG